MDKYIIDLYNLTQTRILDSCLLTDIFVKSFNLEVKKTIEFDIIAKRLTNFMFEHLSEIKSQKENDEYTAKYNISEKSSDLEIINAILQFYLFIFKKIYTRVAENKSLIYNEELFMSEFLNFNVNQENILFADNIKKLTGNENIYFIIPGTDTKLMINRVNFINSEIPKSFSSKQFLNKVKILYAQRNSASILETRNIEYFIENIKKLLNFKKELEQKLSEKLSDAIKLKIKNRLNVIDSVLGKLNFDVFDSKLKEIAETGNQSDFFSFLEACEFNIEALYPCVSHYINKESNKPIGSGKESIFGEAMDGKKRGTTKTNGRDLANFLLKYNTKYNKPLIICIVAEPTYISRQKQVIMESVIEELIYQFENTEDYNKKVAIAKSVDIMKSVYCIPSTIPREAKQFLPFAQLSEFTKMIYLLNSGSVEKTCKRIKEVQEIAQPYLENCKIKNKNEAFTKLIVSEKIEKSTQPTSLLP